MRRTAIILPQTNPIQKRSVNDYRPFEINKYAILRPMTRFTVGYANNLL
jgi:hypothetical protein